MASIGKYYDLIVQSIKGGEQDYTTGSIRKAVFLLSVPMILEMCLESVFAVVDIFFVNRLGSDAVSVVGLTEAVITIVYSIGIGLSAGATATIARRIGEKNPDGAARAAIQSLFVAGAVILVLSLAGYYFAEDILRLMGAQESAITSGVGYTKVMFGGCGVIILLFLINGIFRGAGDAAIAMKSLWLANACNIVLCPVLIFGWGPAPEMGIVGAAVATAVGRGIGVLYQGYHLFKGKKGIIQIRRPHWLPEWKIIRSLISIASPATFQFIIQSASWIFLAGIVARSGSEASAGYQTAIRLIVFFILPAWGLSNAAATLVGQNLGAKRPDRAEQSVWVIAKYNGIFMAFVMLFFLVFAHPLIAFFIPDVNTLQYEIGVQSLQVISTGYIFYGIGMVLMQAFNGAGDTRTPTWISFIGFWLVQVPLAYVLAFVYDLGPLGVFLAVPIAESLIALAYWYFFKKGKWKLVEV